MPKQGPRKVSRIKSFALLCVILFAFLCHVGFGFLLGGQNQWPLVEIVIMSASLLVIFRWWLKSRVFFGWLGFVNFCGWVLMGLFLWWTQIYSSYSESHANLVKGDYLPHVINGFDDPSFQHLTRDRDREYPSISSNKATLFVFIRGWW